MNRNIDELWTGTNYRETCPDCGGKLESGYRRENGTFNRASYVPQQHSAARHCPNCNAIWTVAGK